jgi:KAP family P-loop domain
MTSPFRSDAPATRDAFGRTAFINAVIGVVSQAPSERSFIVALNGPWGSGKSTILNRVAFELLQRETDAVVQFNPWQCNSLSQLMADLFETLSNSVEELSRKTKSNQRLETLRRAFGALAVIAKSVPFISPVGEAAAHLGEVAGLGTAGTATVAAQRKEIIETLAKSDFRLVLLVDDIDRLRAEEIRELVRLLRVVADFPNTIVIAAFDRDRVARALEPQNPREGNAYLEKVVQLSLDVPLFTTAGVKELLKTGLSGLGANDRFVERRIAPLFATPREVNRVLNSIPPLLEMLEGQVSVDDLVALETMRTLDPTHATPEAFMRIQADAAESESIAKAVEREGLTRFLSLLENTFQTMKDIALESGGVAHSTNLEAYAHKRRNSRLPPLSEIKLFIAKVKVDPAFAAREITPSMVSALRAGHAGFPNETRWAFCRELLRRAAGLTDRAFADAIEDLAFEWHFIVPHDATRLATALDRYVTFRALEFEHLNNRETRQQRLGYWTDLANACRDANVGVDTRRLALVDEGYFADARRVLASEL